MHHSTSATADGFVRANLAVRSHRPSKKFFATQHSPSGTPLAGSSRASSTHPPFACAGDRALLRWPARISAVSFLGIDVGATKSGWAFRSATDVRHAGVLSRGAQAAILGPERATEVVASLVREVLGRPEVDAPSAVVLAVAGAGTAEVREHLAASVAEEIGAARESLHVVSDVLAAAATCLSDAPGILVWSGTGSFVVGRGEDGRLHRKGGRGPFLSDLGSGYDLVRTAAISAVDGEEELGPPTDLGKALSAHFRCEVLRLGTVLSAADSAGVAAALPVVLEVAAQGDVVAQSVLTQGNARLGRMVTAMVHGLGVPPEAVQLWMGGGVLRPGSPLFDRFLVDAVDLGFVVPPRAVPVTAAEAAAELARAATTGAEPLASWVRDGAA